ncbi:MAG: hypothetical protein U5P41_05345 [Gammaproteobacteria bacterium]|nr:hypothetical protein [Gammaproteobacteria bacterium]
MSRLKQSRKHQHTFDSLGQRHAVVLSAAEAVQQGLICWARWNAVVNRVTLAWDPQRPAIAGSGDDIAGS